MTRPEKGQTRESLLSRLAQFLEKYDVWLIALFAATISIISTTYYFRHHDILLYGDAVSRIDIARRVIDSKQRGIVQLGGVWLPLPQVLYIPFVAFPKLWHNGLAGSIVEMISFVIAGVYLYRTGKYITGKAIGGLTAALILLLNPNILYMQSTPMSELLLIATILAGTFYFIRWFNEKDTFDLLKSSGWIFLATWVRYEAWMVLVFCCAMILVKALGHKGLYKKAEGQFLLFATVGFFGIALWVLWSLVIFHDILYWFNGPYSANNQQDALAAAGQLPTKHNLILTFVTYFKALRMDIGTTIFIVGLVSLATLAVLAFVRRSKEPKELRLAAVLLVLLSAPAALDLVSLYDGSINISTSLSSLAGTRYGLESIPFVAILISLALSQVKLASLRIIATGALVATYLIMPLIVSLQSPKLGTNNSLFYSNKLATVVMTFRDNYKGGTILASTSGNSLDLTHAVGLPYRDYIQQGDGTLWARALANPEKYATYVISTSGSAGYLSPGEVYGDSYVLHRAKYNKYYTLIYDNNGYMIFALKSLHLKSANST